MELCGQNSHIGILVHNPPGCSRSAEQVDQDDVVLRHLVLLQHLHGFANFIARAHDWVEQENLGGKAYIDETFQKEFKNF